MDYRFRLKLFQVAAGDENAKVRISHGSTVLVESVDITSTDGFNPSVVELEVTGLSAPAADTSITFKIELLNDAVVDGVTNRDVGIASAFYIPKRTGFDVYSMPATVEVGDERSVRSIEIKESMGDSAHFWMDATPNISLVGGEAQPEDWVPNNWILITESNVEISMPLSKTWNAALDTAYYINVADAGNFTLLD